jgi:proteasome lid subunit RPN8/RPN11
MRPEDQLRIFREMEVESLDMVAIYHSHPHVSPFPSDRDMELAFYPDVAHIIISLQNGSPAVKGFRISKGKIAIEPIRVMG